MQEYPRRLHHAVPPWVEDAAYFHVRVRVGSWQTVPLTEPGLAAELLNAAKRYHELNHWDCALFLLMPDHLHAIVSVPRPSELAIVLRNWKRGTARFQGIDWQSNFFDHRLRNDAERMKASAYIRQNPVACGLCADAADWAWWWSSGGVKHAHRARVSQSFPGRTLGRAAQRVEVNALHQGIRD